MKQINSVSVTSYLQAMTGSMIILQEGKQAMNHKSLKCRNVGSLKDNFYFTSLMLV